MLKYKSSTIQTIFKEITTATTTVANNVAPDSLLLIPITVSQGSSLILQFSVSCSQTLANSFVGFYLRIYSSQFAFLNYGAVQVCCSVASRPNSAAIVRLTPPMDAGTYTAAIYWYLPSTGTGQISPNTTVNEHACLLVEEICEGSVR